MIILVVSIHPLKADWEQMSGPGGGLIGALCVKDSMVFAGTGNKIYRSDDNGENWILVNAGLEEMRIHSFAVNGNMIFAGSREHMSGGIYRSDNDGIHWTRITPENWMGVNTLAVSDNTIFAGIDVGIYRSTDNGTSWARVDSAFKISVVYSFAMIGDTIFAGAMNGVYRSTDNGASWKSVNSGFTSTDVRTFAVSGGTIFAGTFYGDVFRSDNNGESWTAVGSNIAGLRIWSLAVIGNTVFAGTLDNGVYRFDNNGTDWTNQFRPSVSSCKFSYCK